MGKVLVENLDKPAMNLCLSGFCASLEYNKCMVNRDLAHLYVFQKKWEPINGCPTILIQTNLSDCLLVSQEVNEVKVHLLGCQHSISCIHSYSC